jgi:mono/diheme cytochrome c family protein
MRIPKSVLWILLAVILVGVGYGAFLEHRGFSTKDPPSALEIAIARSARDMAIPSSAKDMKNPYPATAENITAGLQHFADHCSACHGNDGSGNTEMGPNLYPKAPDMRLPETQNLTDGELYYIITNGVRMTGMPGWGPSHTPEDTWKLVLFIRHLPQMTPLELKNMTQFNPKSYDDDDDAGGTPAKEDEKKDQK